MEVRFALNFEGQLALSKVGFRASFKGLINKDEEKDACLARLRAEVNLEDRRHAEED